MNQDTQDAKDAARYRWLRDESVDQWEHPIVVSQSKMNDSMRYVGPLSAGVLDAAVDAAIAALPVPDAQQ